MSLAIYIPAYNAERQVADVMRRIPAQVLARTAEIVLIDNASTDGTSEIGRRTARQLGWSNFTLIRNEVNRGYGGSQKMAYAHCIARGHDAVVMLHADGQYAPELIDHVAGPVERGEADMCFGSRLAGDALAGRMPLHRYWGNRVLTAIANRVLGWRLSEFHSGYRAYRCAALARLPLHRNAGYYHFDVEILIQCRAFGLRVAEVPIPTHYGDEDNHLNVWRTGFSILAVLFEYELHKLGIRQCAKYMERAA